MASSSITYPNHYGSNHAGSAAESVREFFESILPTRHTPEASLGSTIHSRTYTPPFVRTKATVVKSAATAAITGILLREAHARSKSPRMLTGLDAAVGVLGFVGSFASRDSEAGDHLAAMGAIGTANAAADLLDMIQNRTHPVAPAPAAATVHGEMGAEDPIVRAAKAL